MKNKKAIIISISVAVVAIAAISIFIFFFAGAKGSMRIGFAGSETMNGVQGKFFL